MADKNTRCFSFILLLVFLWQFFFAHPSLSLSPSLSPSLPPSIWRSSSYSSAALEFEHEHQIAPVFDSPRMSRRSLRLHTATGLYGNDGLADESHNHNTSYSNTSSASSSTKR